ncbi:MAG: glycosyltransferase [Planctomycetaceae bacterium]|nr:glycosyltransferase [Planctomycetaceae bacterium]
MSDTPTRIAFCITELDPGGAERALVRIVSGLDRDRWSPHVYCLAERGPLADDLDAANVPVTCLNVRSNRDVGVIGRLTRALREFQPELLQTFMFHGNLVGRIAAWWAGVPHVVAGVRVVEPDMRWRMRLDRWTNRLVDHTVCVSRAVADAYLDLGYGEDQLTVVPNGVDFERFANAEPADLTTFGIPRNSHTIISVGRLHPQKGFDRLIDAFADVTARATVDEPFHLMIVGEGPERQMLESQIDRLGLNAHVHLIGRQPETAPLLRATDLFVLSSRWEGMPNVLLEAMAAGLPCVATNVEGVAELITDEKTGLCVSVDGTDELLSAAIERLITNTTFAGEIATSGQARVREAFTWEQTIQGFESVWERVLGHPAGGRR